MRSKVLRYLEALSDVIHPQLPLNNRESQKLLSLLNSSFRRELDRNHPLSVPAEHRGPAATLERNLLTSNQRASSRVATAQHLDAILNHPLFHEPKTAPVQDARVALLTASGGYDAAKKDFNAQVANGTADENAAVRFLQRIDALASSFVHSKADRKERLKETGAASTVLTWLWSSGSDSMPTDQSLVKVLMRQLVAEDRQDFVWTTLSNSNRSSQHAAIPKSLQRGNMLIFYLLVAEIEFSSSMDRPIASFLHGLDVLADTSPLHHTQQQELFRAGGVKITDLLVNGLAVSATGFDRWLQHLDRWTTPQHHTAASWTDFVRARLLAAHAQQPDAQPAHRLVSGGQLDAAAARGAKNRSRVLQMCLVATEVLLARGQNGEARQMVEYMRRQFESEEAAAAAAAAAVATEEKRDEDKGADRVSLMASMRELLVGS